MAAKGLGALALRVASSGGEDLLKLRVVGLGLTVPTWEQPAAR